METTEREVPIEEQAEAAEVFTQGLVDTFELGARAKSVIDDDVVVVEVTGNNLGLLVGPKGATLHASVRSTRRAGSPTRGGGRGLAPNRRARA